MNNITSKKLIGVLLGNVILGIGVSILRFSQMGNDPFSSFTMSYSDITGIGLGTFQLGVNLVLLIFQLIWGRKYIGFGSIINLFFLGYIVQFSNYIIEDVLRVPTDFSFIKRLIIMLVALIILTFGLAMYQVAELGVAPYDFLALGISEHSSIPYFALRIFTDGLCVLLICIGVFTHLTNWQNSHLGIGTIITAFFLGPLVQFFSKWHKKWMG